MWFSVYACNTTHTASDYGCNNDDNGMMIMKTEIRNVTTLQHGEVLWAWKQNLSIIDVGVRWRKQFCRLIPTSTVPIG
jgi:hypothetical protein